MNLSVGDFTKFKTKLKDEINKRVYSNDIAYSRYTIGGYKNGKKIKISSYFEEVKIDESFADSISSEITYKFQKHLKDFDSYWYHINFEFSGDDYTGFHWVGDVKDGMISIVGEVIVDKKQ